ncbi:MAG: C25 family cysteine peptidase, partial [Candidatus Cloacimonadaceae bacterium]|nr:C25 family cysteine peptidase [Candidatus Cloacimonadaceae bacterium]
EHNWEHLDNIRAQLLDFVYTQVDRIYDNEGAGTQDLIDSLNEGKSLVNYCGEGYPSHWVAPEFWISDAENLSNTDMLPFIHVVSCWTGQFYDGTCLAEALMRSRSANAAEARGAIAVYAAAPEQGISPPMEAQDHAMQLLVSGTKNTIGGLCYNGSNSMIDEYGEWGTYNFLAWNLFGDASLVLRTKPALQIDAILPIELPPYYANLDIDTGSPDIQVSLSRDGVHVISGFSDASGMAHLVFPQYPVPGDRYLLTLSGIDRIPLQRQLVCHPYGSHAVLDLRVLDSVQFIEPEVVISKTIIIQNLGSVPAQNIRVYLQSDDPNQYFVPVVGYQDLGEILPGEVKQAELSFRIGKGTPDMTTLYYSIMTNHHGYQIECIEVIKAPMIIVEEVLRSPQANWVNPGDSFSVILHIRNTGSVALRGLAGQLTPDSDFLQIVPQQTNLTINPGCTDSLVFSATLSPACPIDEIIGYSLLMDAQNGLGSSWWTWMVTAPGITVESFETRDFQTFPWVYRSDQWSIVNTNMDGLYGLRSEAVTADSVVLGLSFFSQREGSLSFRYSKYPSYSDTWSFRIDQVPVAELTSDNFSMSFDLSRGHHQISWVGKRDPAHAGFESNLWLDLIKFPSGTLFDNASLQADVSHLDITLAPGEIRKLPITLSSADGKCLLYSAVLQNATLRGGPGLYCNRNTFNPGTAELFLFTLHNVSPNGSIKNVSISLPDNVLASLASNFSSPGQITLPFTGNLGSMSLLNWESGNGSNADSLLAWVRLVIDADLEAIQLPYRIQYTDATGSPSELLGSIDLLSADSLNACLRISNAEGEIDDEEKAILFITANQNRMHGTQDAYTLKVYFNANHLLSIPINVTYDSDPPGFFDTPRLSGYPNPFRDQITFAYAVPQDGGIELLLYNLRGQKVRTLVSQDMAKGYYRTAWDACDDHGRRVGNGIYFCRIKTSAGLSRTIKCVVLK